MLEKFAALSLVGLSLAGCGTFVPSIQELAADKVAGQQLVQSIVYNVHCEVQDAIDRIYNNPDHPRRHTFLDTWAANIALSLQVDEKSSISPVSVWSPPSPATALFTLGMGGSVSAAATRQDKLNSFYTVQQLRDLGPCDPATRPGGLLLMQSDLGLEDWLRSNVTAADTGIIQYASDYSDGPSKTNVLSHEIKFVITTSGNVTPAWKLTRITVNQTGTLFSTSRDRTNDLTITLGPTLPTPKPKTDRRGRPLLDASGRPLVRTHYQLSTPAAEAALSSQIGLAVSNALRGTLQPQ
jgi:hypothetical protein